MAGPSGSSLRFTVEVAADQASQTLKAMTLAFNEAGAQARIALSQVRGPAEESAKGIASLEESVKSFARTQRSEARTVGFFVKELESIGVGGSGAKLALEGLGAFLLGGGFAGAIGIAIVAIRALTEAWREEEESTRKADEANQKAIEELDKRIEGLRNRTGGEKANEERLQIQAQIQAHQQLIAQLEGENETLKKKAKSSADGYAIDWNIFEVNRKRIEQAEHELGQLDIRKQKLEQIVRLEVQSADARAAAHLAKTPKAPGAAGADEEEPTGSLLMQRAAGWSPKDQEQMSAATASVVERSKADAKALADVEKQAADARKAQMREAEQGQHAYENSVRSTIATQRQWGQAIGQVMGQLVTGQMTAQQALAAVGQMMIKTITDIAIASITASASKGAGEAFASQAGIPIVGPALAVAAMGAAMSTVLGLLSNVGGGGSAAGASVPSYSTPSIPSPTGISPEEGPARERVIIYVGDPFMTPAENAAAIARRMDLVERLDLRSKS